MTEHDFKIEFDRIIDTNYPWYNDSDDRRARVAAASEDELVHMLFLTGKAGYINKRERLEMSYYLSPKEADDAISLGVEKIADDLREDHQEIRRKFEDGEA